MTDQQIRVIVKVKRGKQLLGKSTMRFCEGAYPLVDLQRIYLPTVVRRALLGAAEAGMRRPDGDV